MNLLFFTPHMALWEHTAPEALLAKGLAERGHQVRYLSCERAFSYCAPMTARGLRSDAPAGAAEPICRSCEAGAASLRQAYGFPQLSLASLLSAEDVARCAAMASEAVSRRDLDLQHLGVPVGRVSLYEFTLAHKKMSTELSPEQWLDYQVHLENALRSLLGFARCLERERPDAVLAFSPQYSNLNAAMQLALARGIRVLFLESGTNLSHRLGSMRAWDWGVHKLVNPALQSWGQSRLNPLSREGAQAIVGHYRQLLSGQHFAVFSPPLAGAERGGLRRRWGIPPGRKLLLLTLSSYDEAYAALLIGAFPEAKVFSDVFRTQAEWLRATLDWAATRPDLSLVIRVHPRDFPNKREQVRSEQSRVLEGLLQGVPANVHVNWPSEGVPLYEVLEETDVMLTGWSVTAIEALSLGIPVVTYDAKLPSYPADIHRTGRSEAEYFANIEAALAEGWSAAHAAHGLRWMAYNFTACTVTASRSFGRFEVAGRSALARLWTRATGRLPRLRRALDLAGWRQAREGAALLDALLTRGFNSIGEARAAERSADPPDDRAQVDACLAELHALFYRDAGLPADKPGLSLKIRTHLSEPRP